MTPRTKHKIVRYLSRYHLLNFGISLFLAILVYCLIDPASTAYTIEQTFEESTNDQTFVDFDNNGIDDKVKQWTDDGTGFRILQVRNSSGGFIDQWNFESKMELVRGWRVGYGNFDHNSFDEAYSIGQKDTNLYLSIMDPSISGVKEVEFIWLDSIVCLQGVQSVRIAGSTWTDVNKDGFDELILALNGNMKTVYPRRLYAIDIKNRIVLSRSPSAGSVIGPRVVDLDGDGSIEIVGSSSSFVNNEPDSLPFLHDHSSWFVVYDSALNVIRKPYEINGKYSKLTVFFNNAWSDKEMFGLEYHLGSVPKPPTLHRVNSDYSIEKIFEFPEDQSYGSITLRTLTKGSEARLVVISEKSGLFYFDEKLQLVKQVVLGFQPEVRALLHYGKDKSSTSLLVRNVLDNSYLCYDWHGKVIADIKSDQFPDWSRGFGYTNAYNGGSNYNKTKKNLYYFDLKRNHLYYLRVLLFIFLFVVSYMLIRLVRWNYGRQLAQVAKLENQMRRLELNAIKNQLDPHFTFNALNVLNFLADNHDTAGIKNFTEHFSKLLRRQLASSDKPRTQLSDELEFIEHYVALQKLRYEIVIDLHVRIDDQVDTGLLIPKMMIHTHVENAIKHGLLPKKGGDIYVRIQNIGENVVFEIENNGQARHSKTTNEYSSGRGLAILDQLFKLHKTLYDISINQEIIDLKGKEGEGIGTLIRITI